METVHVELTDEMKAKLNRVLGFDVKAEFKYVLKAYRENDIPKSMWPVFTLTTRDGVETARMEDSIGEIKYGADGSRTVKLNSGTQRISTLEAGIVAIKNYILENGDLLSFNKAKAELTVSGKLHKDASVLDAARYLSPAVQGELQNAINERLTLTEEELRGLE